MSADADLTEVGFGLQYGVVRLERMTASHVAAGAALRTAVADELQPLVTHVEHIGSSAVVGLLAKPIVDLAVGATDDTSWEETRARLEALGWLYRGDAGEDGGHVFVLDAREWFRVAHLHVVPHDGPQWRNYLQFRDRLRTDAAARARYETTKLDLAARHSEDRPAYTEGKSDVVGELLDRRVRRLAEMVDYGVISLCDHLTPPDGSAQASQATRLHSIADQAVRAEEAGFALFGVGEHHFSDYILPSPELMLAHVAARTSTIRLGTSVTLLAKRDPVRYAEAFAVLDVLSNGRAEATFARGVSERTAQVFGIEDFDELRPIFDEHLRLVLRLLTEDEVTWEGEHRTPLDDVRIEPRPIQSPRDAFWIGGGLSTVSAELAAELGLPLHLPSLFRWPNDYIDVVQHYRSSVKASGTTGQIGFPSYVHVAKTSQEAKARWRPHLDHYVDFAVGTRSSFGRPTDFDSLVTGPAICGSPAEVTERIVEINETLGLDRHIFLMDVGALPDAALHEAIGLMGAEVLPALG